MLLSYNIYSQWNVTGMW